MELLPAFLGWLIQVALFGLQHRLSEKHVLPAYAVGALLWQVVLWKLGELMNIEGLLGIVSAAFPATLALLFCKMKMTKMTPEEKRAVRTFGEFTPQQKTQLAIVALLYFPWAMPTLPNIGVHVFGVVAWFGFLIPMLQLHRLQNPQKSP